MVTVFLYEEDDGNERFIQDAIQAPVMRLTASVRHHNRLMTRAVKSARETRLPLVAINCLAWKGLAASTQLHEQMFRQRREEWFAGWPNDVCPNFIQGDFRQAE